MLNLSGDDMFSLISIELSQSLKDHVVRLGCSRCKYNLFLVCTNQLSYLLSCLLYGSGGVPAELVGFRMRITIVLSEVGHHGIENAIVNGCGGLVVEVLNFLVGEGEEGDFGLSEGSEEMV